MWHGGGEEENVDQGKMMGGTGGGDGLGRGGRENQYQIISTRFNNKLVHPQSDAEPPDQAQWPKFQIDPIDS